MVAKEASERQYTPDLNGLSVPKVSFGDGPVGEAPPVMEGSLMPLPAGDPSLESVPLDPILAESELRVAISAVGGEVVERRDLPDDAGFSLAAQLDGSRVKELAKRAQMAVQSVIVSELPTRTVPRPGSPEALQLREIENRLNAAKKRRDQARIDFVPEAPILRDLDDEIAGLMKEIQEIQRKISKVATVMLVVRTRRQDPLKLVEPKSENPPLNF